MRSGTVLLLPLLCACTVYVSRAEQTYEGGRYLETVEQLAEREHEVSKLSTTDQARYGVYRGMAHLRIGDHEGARRWLSFAQELESRQPTLDPQRRQLLDTGWQELNRATVTAPRGGGGPSGARAPER